MKVASRFSQLIAALHHHPSLGPEIVHVEELVGEAARWGELDPPLPAALRSALGSAGIDRLWRHQAEGIEAVRRGENVLLTTPTASGKSLVFQLPVLEAVVGGGGDGALFLFPLKALGQDQRKKLEALRQAAGLTSEAAGCEIYDGDTPPVRRAAIRERPPRVLISNPDMLHLGILGHPGRWQPFLASLRWIVLDELHTYRGIFGSHFHHVLQRFLRLCRHAGAEPQLIASSATAVNADEFARSLTGQPFRWIRETGAPREARRFVLLRPAASPYTTVLRLLTELLAAGLKTIVFTKARRITELLYSWLRQQQPELARRVACYRSGFLPEERREIEAALFAGRLDGVISTSALEMGIDVGGLDACILAGYPGSMMATWQRSGRVGRAGRDSLTALVALPDALDQYLLDHPQRFLRSPCERLVVDPLNEPVSRAHLLCAAAERPLRRTDDAAYLERHAPLVGDLLRQGELLETADGEPGLFSRRRRPHRDVHLRGSGDSHGVFDLQRERTVGTVDGVRVLHECHPGAVYMHGGRQYLVEELDLERRRALVRPARVDHFTTPLTEKETEILEVLADRREGPLQWWLGRLEVTERVVGYERKRLRGQEVLGQHRLDLPPVHFETVGLWWTAPRPVEERLRERGRHLLGSLHASEHAAISLFPLLVLCDRGDIGGISIPLHPQVGQAAVFVYDGHPGGVGLAARGFAELPKLLGQVAELIAACPCDAGCPSCIQSPKCGNGNRPLDKAGALEAVRLLLGLEPLPGVPDGVELRDVGGRRPERPRRRRERIAVEAPRSPARRRRRRRRRPRPPLPRRPERTVVFDLETRRSAEQVGGWSNVHRMGLAAAVVCRLEEDRFEVFRESEVAALVAALREADLVVGFNVLSFDYRVLNGYTGTDYTRLLPTRDVCEEVFGVLGRRLGLAELSASTLGLEKSADGLTSLEWVREGRLDLVEEYCRRDVEVLRDLYLFGRREGYVCYRDRATEQRLKIPVEW